MVQPFAFRTSSGTVATLVLTVGVQTLLIAAVNQYSVANLRNEMRELRLADAMREKEKLRWTEAAEHRFAQASTELQSLRRQLADAGRDSPSAARASRSLSTDGSATSTATLRLMEPESEIILANDFSLSRAASGISTIASANTLNISAATSVGVNTVKTFHLGQMSHGIPDSTQSLVSNLRINASGYYKGFDFSVHMAAGKDWGSHGHATYSGKFVFVQSSTSGGRVYLVEESSASYLQGSNVINFAGYKYHDVGEGDAASSADDHIYLMFSSPHAVVGTAPAQPEGGWRPDVTIVVHDCDDLVSAASVTFDDEPGGLTFEPVQRSANTEVVASRLSAPGMLTVHAPSGILSNSVKTFYLGQMNRGIPDDQQAHVSNIKVSFVGYYSGFSFDVFMAGGKDWGSHGYATYRGRFLFVQSSTTGGRLYLCDEHSASYLQGSNVINYAGYKYADVGSTDNVYLTFRSPRSTVGTAPSGGGWQPRVTMVFYDVDDRMVNATASFAEHSGSVLAVQRA